MCERLDINGSALTSESLARLRNFRNLNAFLTRSGETPPKMYDAHLDKSPSEINGKRRFWMLPLRLLSENTKQDLLSN